ncbi:hypothetical protein HDU77_004898 [Chytriomyces hyalinus]|nr:hypothetical protein HDU77_004898 [Chytriomyces hyalinus]
MESFLASALEGILDLKSNTSDLVTATDKAVEQLIFAHLRQLHPTHSFIGEETYDNAQLTDNYTWIIDPVDGTTNFVHGFPYTCVSVALVFEKRAVVGVVLNPILNETFYAAKGMGAWMIDADGVKHALPLHGLKPWAGFARSLISTEYGYERDERLDSKLKSLTSVLKAPSVRIPCIGVRIFVRGVRSLGSAALEACYTARGTFDLYWEAGVHM